MTAPAARPVVGQPRLRRVLRHAVCLCDQIEGGLVRLLRADLIGAVGAVAQILGHFARIVIGERDLAAARTVRDRAKAQIASDGSGVNANVRLTATCEDSAVPRA